jgi:hypothetical protein
MHVRGISSPRRPEKSHFDQRDPALMRRNACAVAAADLAHPDGAAVGCRAQVVEIDGGDHSVAAA